MKRTRNLFYFISLLLLVSSGAMAAASPDTIPVPAGPNTDSIYRAHLSSAESLFRIKKYETSLAEFELAMKIKPNDPAVKERIVKVKELIEQEKKNEAEYRKMTVAGDQYFTAKDYLNAKASYQMALDNKPGDSYATGKLNETMTLLRAQKAQNILYDVAIASADKLYQEKDYPRAIAEYEKAAKIMPGEPYPNQKINEIIKIQVDKQVRDELYQQAITKADNLYSTKKYPGALTEYQNALKQKPEETYPQEKIKELTELLKLIRATDDDYQQRLASADQLFAGKQYADARNEYVEAGKIKPQENYPKNRIREIDGILDAMKKSAADYERIVSVADSFYIEKNFIRAKMNYQAAQQIKPGEPYLKEMLAKINDAMSKLEMDQKAIEEAFSAALAQADRLFIEQKWDEAKSEYNNALSLKPGEPYPTRKIAEIDKILADLAAKKAGDELAAAQQRAIDEKYDAAIANADKLFNEKSYDPAKTEYQTALGIKPSEEYPKTRIAEIDKIFADIAAAKLKADQDAIERQKAEELARLKQIDDQYLSLITKADGLFAASDFLGAKGSYQEALTVKSGETYPSDKIKEIDIILADLAAQKAAEELATAQQRAIDEKYSAAIANADKLFNEKSYDLAKKEYQNALGIKPSEEYPKTRIAEIDRIFTDIAAAKLKAEQDAIERQKAEELARLKQIDDQYLSLITKADGLFAAKDFLGAKSGYQEALTVKSGEAYPSEKIKEIDIILADLAAKKAAEELAAAQQRAIDEKYGAAIANADKLFTEKSYDLAKTEYQNALGIKPAEGYPKTRIAEIDKIFADIAAAKLKAEQDAIERQKAEELARLKKIDDQYLSLIAKADGLFAAMDYGGAKSSYQEALTVKSGESYPAEKIKEIDKILADLAAKKAAEELAAAQQRAIDEKYAAAIANADKLFTEKSLDLAKAEYQKAIGIKPGEEYPKTRIAEIEREFERVKTVNEQFKQILSLADNLYTAQKYELSRAEYQKASDLKPEEAYPKFRITEIDKLLAEIRLRNEAYEASVVKADQLFSEKKYEEARAEYQAAAEIKTSEAYPKSRISEIVVILAEIKGKKATYDNLVKTGDDFLASSDYYKAKESFSEALLIFPDEAYPKQRIAFLTARIDSIYRVNKADYDKAVANGDRAFNAYEYDKAIDAYEEASRFLPMEKYPKEMIARIRKTIEENAIVDVLKSTIKITGGDEKQFSFTPVAQASRKDNFVYVKIRNLSGKPFNILMRYGKDTQANGGVVIRNISSDGNLNERLISVRDQDLWYRADNNWISLYPQGGDIEVSFIQISRAIQ